MEKVVKEPPANVSKKNIIRFSIIAPIWIDAKYSNHTISRCSRVWYSFQVNNCACFSHHARPTDAGRLHRGQACSDTCPSAACNNRLETIAGHVDCLEFGKSVERAKGIEPSYAAWETACPLHQINHLLSAWLSLGLRYHRAQVRAFIQIAYECADAVTRRAHEIVLLEFGDHLLAVLHTRRDILMSLPFGSR